MAGKVTVGLASYYGGGYTTEPVKHGQWPWPGKER